MSESDQQATIVKWWRLQYPQLSKLLISSQSGAIIGGKNKFGSIAKLKKEGWQSGVPDLFIAVPRGGKHGLWIELKDVKKIEKALSEEQNEYLVLLSEQGYEAIWCAGSDIAIAAIKTYMNEATQ